MDEPRLANAKDVKINGRHPLDVPNDPHVVYCILTHPDPAHAAYVPDMYGLPHGDFAVQMDDGPAVTREDLNNWLVGSAPSTLDHHLKRLLRSDGPTLWTDELWLTIAQRWSWAVDGSDRGRLDVKLLAAKTRTRPAVLQSLNPSYPLTNA
jgi:hypothetical protein